MTSRANREGRTYGTPIPSTPSPGATRVSRPRVGEADPATRRAALDSALNAREPAGRYQSSPKPKPAVQPSGVSPNAARLLRDRGRQIDAEVNKRVK